MLTLSLIKADTGGFVGHTAVQPDMVAEASRAIDRARGDLFIDGQVATCDRARDQANEVMDYLRRHGPFEPHRLGLDEMEYTTMPFVGARASDRWQSLDEPSVLEEAAAPGGIAVALPS